MTNQKIEFFVHTQGTKPQVIHAALDEPLCDVLGRAGVTQEDQDDLLIFVGESDEVLHEPDGVKDGVDEQSPVDANLPIEKFGLQVRHIHCYGCRHVAVDVNFGAQTEQWKFSPATTISVVTRWSRRKLRLDDAAAADYVLRACGTNDQPRSDTYLGELVSATCSLCFNLVKEVTPQG